MVVAGPEVMPLSRPRPEACDQKAVDRLCRDAKFGRVFAMAQKKGLSHVECVIDHFLIC